MLRFGLNRFIYFFPALGQSSRETSDLSVCRSSGAPGVERRETGCSGQTVQSEALLFWFVSSVYLGVSGEPALNLEEVTSGCLDDVITGTCRGVFV